MKETIFIQRNGKRWRETELALNSESTIGPDRLYELFIELTDDLAYARTYYRGSITAEYLNQLTIKAHEEIYKNKKEKRNQLTVFFKYQYPYLIYKYRKYITYAFIFTLITFVLGFFSAAYDTGFVRLILSDNYVNMTMENIRSGDPTAVYKSMNQADGFFLIAFNNIKVSFIAFVGGFLLTFGTLLLLLNNGVMLGSFLYMFYEQSLLPEATSVIFIHGTLEIFSIIVAGASGLVLGTSILFPGTHSRLYAFKRGALDGMMMVLGLMPVFIMAAFFESFITRYSNMPIFLKMTIIGVSLIFIIWYYYIYPRKFKQQNDGKNIN